MKRRMFRAVAALALTLGVGAPMAIAADSPIVFDAATQAQFDAAKKVIPGLTPELFDGAKKEGGLNFYRLGYNFKEAMFPGFLKLFPFLKTTEYEAVADALLQRYGAEARTGRVVADIVMGSLPPAFDAFDKEGLVTHYVPTLADKFKLGSKEGVYYPYGRYQVCNAYNSDKVSEADAKILASWDGLTNPRFKDKAAIVRYGTGGIGIVPYYYLDTVKGPAFAKSVFGQNPLIFSSVPVMTERLAAGGFDAIFFANDANLYQLLKLGAPVRWVCPEPSLVLFSSQIIGYKAPHPNAAKLWIEYAMSDEGQKLVMSTLGFGAGRTDIPDIRPFSSQPWFKQPTKFFEFSWDDVLVHQPDLLAKWNVLSSGIKAGD